MRPWFTPELFRFFEELEKNNDRAWFEANKARYEEHVKAPALRFIEAFAEPLKTISPHFLAIPKAQGGSLFRIYRDTRFSADKTPYKTNTGMHFRHATAADAYAPGFYLHLQPGHSGVGIGVWMPPAPELARIRDAVASQPERWREVRARIAASGLEIGERGNALKKVPRGYPADHPHAEDLKLKSFVVWTNLDDALVTSPELMERFTETCVAGAPLARFVCEALSIPF